jgi:hypothetical protein
VLTGLSAIYPWLVVALLDGRRLQVKIRMAKVITMRAPLLQSIGYWPGDVPFA